LLSQYGSTHLYVHKGGLGKELGSSKDSSKLSEINSEKDNFNITASVSKAKPDSKQTKVDIYKKLLKGP